ncbi:MAG TPA: DUF86 domain-containing protein [Sedimentisphaerales bacterium]|jgi:uncharacterized protein with HEPN domain|nr:DUF86 domain-containing protein [Sedimentisphaerales bacterium]
MWRDDAYLLDMLLAARKVGEFTRDVSWERFQADELMQNAVMRQIQIIGEAARKVSPEYQKQHPEIAWQQVIGMRNRLVHEYFRIIPERVWDVVERDIPELVRVIEPLVPPDTSSEAQD